MLLLLLRRPHLPVHNQMAIVRCPASAVPAHDVLLGKHCLVCEMLSHNMSHGSKHRKVAADGKLLLATAACYWQ